MNNQIISLQVLSVNTDPSLRTPDSKVKVGSLSIAMQKHAGPRGRLVSNVVCCILRLARCCGDKSTSRIAGKPLCKMSAKVARSIWAVLGSDGGINNALPSTSLRRPTV